MSGRPFDNDGQRKRKKRVPLNCSECRRLKMKCDREVPCGGCIRRHCAELCTGIDRAVSRRSLTKTSTPEPRSPEGLRVAGHSDRRPDEWSPNDQVHNGVLSGGPDGFPGQSYLPQGPSSTSVVHGPFHPGERNADRLHVGSSLLNRATTGHPPTPTRARQVTAVESDPSANAGSLRLDKGGRSRYFGHTAASQWLRDQGANEEMDIPSFSGPPTPQLRPDPQPLGTTVVTDSPLFPFDATHTSMTKTAILAEIPTREEAMHLVDSYYRYYAWHYDVAPRSDIRPLLETLYPSSSPFQADREVRIRLHPQELALLFMIFAMGARHALEWEQGEGPDDRYSLLARTCLTKGDFMTHHTIYGVQTLFIMAAYKLETDEGRTGLSAWPLFGLAMRLIVSMGLHRDGSKWKLPTEVVQQRRRVFWECNAQDVFQANCSSRPNAIHSAYTDTLFPEEPRGDGPSFRADKSYHILKFELAQMSISVIQQNASINAPDYDQVVALHDSFVKFQQSVPYDTRCRTMLEFLPSLYPDAALAQLESPLANKQDVRKTFQQFSLAMNISEMILYLHRPFFAKILYDRNSDPMRSPFALSYLTVVERCTVTVQIVTRLYELYPAVSARHWVFWYHSFNAAACMAVLALRRPTDPLVHVALNQVDSGIRLFSQVSRYRARPTITSNLAWLLRIRQRLNSCTTAAQTSNVLNNPTQFDSDDTDDVDLVGLQTRLIERAVERIPEKFPLFTSGVNNLAAIDKSVVPGFVPLPATAPEGNHGNNGSMDATITFTTPDTAADQFLQQLLNSANFGEIPAQNVTNTVDAWEWDVGAEGLNSQHHPGPFDQETYY